MTGAICGAGNALFPEHLISPLFGIHEFSPAQQFCLSKTSFTGFRLFFGRIYGLHLLGDNVCLFAQTVCDKFMLIEITSLFYVIAQSDTATCQCLALCHGCTCYTVLLGEYTIARFSQYSLFPYYSLTCLTSNDQSSLLSDLPNRSLSTLSPL